MSNIIILQDKNYKKLEGAKTATSFWHFIIELKATPNELIYNTLKIVLPPTMISQSRSVWSATVLSVPQLEISVPPDFIANHLEEEIGFNPNVSGAKSRTAFALTSPILKEWLESRRRYLGYFQEKDYYIRNYATRGGNSFFMDKSFCPITEGDTVYFKESSKLLKDSVGLIKFNHIIAYKKKGEGIKANFGKMIVEPTTQIQTNKGLYLPTVLQKNPLVCKIIDNGGNSKFKNGEYVKLKTLPTLFFVGGKECYVADYKTVLFTAKDKKPLISYIHRTTDKWEREYQDSRYIKSKQD